MPARFAPNDLLTTLLSAGEKTGQGLSNAEIRANIITFILAGYESTANALTWSLFLLSLAPQWRERTEAEVDASCLMDAMSKGLCNGWW